MELPNEAAEMPIPLNSTYGGTHVHAHIIHHHHDPPPPPHISHNHIISSPPIHHPQLPPSGAPVSSPDRDDDNNHHHLLVPFKKSTVKYKECLKNHAASMGGNATDGCGEFMPSGDDGTLEALTCSACSCHRNFHRKEIEGECENINNNGYINNMSSNPRMGRKVYLGHHRGYLGHDGMGYPHVSSRPHPHHAPPHHHHQMIMSYNMGGSLPSESDEMEGNGGGVAMRPPQTAKKRFRTKFTTEQKEKMLGFAEKVGWKIQKQEEGVVQQFCQEVGVKRRVLKVWMHNNKHNLARKNVEQPTSQNQV